MIISCPDTREIVAVVKINGKEFWSNDADFNIIVDGEPYSNPFFTDCTVCIANFPVFWNALKKVNTLKVKAGGKTVIFSTKNIGKVLPRLKSKENPCKMKYQID